MTITDKCRWKGYDLPAVAYNSNSGVSKGGIHLLQNNAKRMMRDYCLGTQMPYHYVPESESSPPDGYQPFFINYLGRHGGRSLTNPDEALWIREILTCAYEHHALTMRGLELISKLNDILFQTQGEYGLLSQSGGRTIEMIAKRLSLNYPETLGGDLTVVASDSESTVESMNIFVHELMRNHQFQKVNLATYPKANPVLNFYELNEAYQRYLQYGNWKKEFIGMEQKNNCVFSVLERIFRDRTYCMECLNKEERERFVLELFKIYTNQIDTNGVISLGYYFSQQERHNCWEQLNLENYLTKGPGLPNQHLTSEISFGLLMDFLSTSEEAIGRKEPSIYARFAHAGTLIPFVSMLDVPGMCEQTGNSYQVSVVWKDYLISPMGANVQWIFYRKDSGNLLKDDVLVQMKYNERVVPFLGKTGKQKSFYWWRDVLQYYQYKLEKLQLNQYATNNMEELVRNYR